MKKISALCLSFFLTGCYDYKEVSNIGLVTAISIDYQEQFEVAVQILHPYQDAEASGVIIITGSGRSVAEAVSSLSKQTPFEIFLGHLQTIIIHTQVTNIEPIVNYFFGNQQVIKTPLLFMSDQPMSLLSALKEDYQTPGILLKQLLEQAHGVNDIRLDQFVQTVERRGVEPYLPIVNYQEDEEEKGELIIGQTALFQDYQKVMTINNEQSLALSLLLGNAKGYLLPTACKTLPLGLTVKSFQMTTTAQQPLAITHHAQVTVIYDDACQGNREEIISNGKENLEQGLTAFIDQVQRQVDVLGYERLYYQFHNQFYQTITDFKTFLPSIKVAITSEITLIKSGAINHE